MRDIIAEAYEEITFMDGYDHCIIGVCESFGQPAKVAYSLSKVISTLMEDMSEEEAWEFFEYNMIGAYVGETTPVFIRDLSDRRENDNE